MSYVKAVLTKYASDDSEDAKAMKYAVTSLYNYYNETINYRTATPGYPEYEAAQNSSDPEPEP